MKKLSYRQKLFTYSLLIFAVFSFIVAYVQQIREKKNRIEIVSASMDAYVGILNSIIISDSIENENHLKSTLEAVKTYLNPNLRISIIAKNGIVLFDNSGINTATLENHASRPEIKKSYINGSAWDIRKSGSLNQDFFYYAKYFDTYYIRVAIPYDNDVKAILKADNIFIYIIIFLFLGALVSLILLSNHFSKTISALKEFVFSAENKDITHTNIQFPDSDFGKIGEKIVENYRLIAKSHEELKIEQEKLIEHFYHSKEGVCFFSGNKKKIFANSLFVQYLNSILDEPTFDVEFIFDANEFKKLNSFVDAHLPKVDTNEAIPFWEDKLNKNGSIFSLKVIIYQDKSFEVNIQDITKTEKNKILKQEMTNNIAHELKTPVSSIRGYMETLLEQKNIDPEKQQYFIERSYAQILRLSELLQDIAIITKIEEASEYFTLQDISLNSIVSEAHTDLNEQIKNLGIVLNINIEPTAIVKGNYSLLYSIFRNLIENTIYYAGNGVEIYINCYMEDDNFLYLNYYDTGNGVDEALLHKIFDRFYRIDEGRSRKTGGSGLGLSIVKNAVLFHGGQISAKNRKDAGLEFIFSLKRS